MRWWRGPVWALPCPTLVAWRVHSGAPGLLGWLPPSWGLTQGGLPSPGSPEPSDPQARVPIRLTEQQFSLWFSSSLVFSVCEGKTCKWGGAEGCQRSFVVVGFSGFIFQSW